MRRVLVTGATGFIGRHSLPLLVSRGYDVHAVTARQPMSVEPGVTWHHADLLAPDAADAVCSTVRPTGLLHFAWSLVPSGSAAPAENLRWVEATLELVRQFERHGGVRAVVAGSCAEYRGRTGIAPKTSLRSNRGRFTERPRTPRDRDARSTFARVGCRSHGDASSLFTVRTSRSPGWSPRSYRRC